MLRLPILWLREKGILFAVRQCRAGRTIPGAITVAKGFMIRLQKHTAANTYAIHRAGENHGTSNTIVGLSGILSKNSRKPMDF